MGSELSLAVGRVGDVVEMVFQGKIEEITERDVIIVLTVLMIVTALTTFIGMTVFNMQARYGRYTEQSWLKNIAIPARLAWFLQELPSFAIPVYIFLRESETVESISIINITVWLMFTGHYFNRTFFYSLSIRGGKPTPLHLFLLGFIFCSWNGYIQAGWHLEYVEYHPKLRQFHIDPTSFHERWFMQYKIFLNKDFFIGSSLFVAGMLINIHSDTILRQLRTPGEIGYKIPRGGCFELVSCANMFGEVLEWLGYALFAGTLTAWAFAFFTAANLIPRARAHHRWYKEHFGDTYPSCRRAIIPFIL